MNSLLKHFYIFPDCITKPREDIHTKVNITDNIITVTCDNKSVNIDTSVLKDWSSTAILYNGISPYVLYDYREILEVMNLTPTELHSATNIPCLMQIDRQGNSFFIKCFLFKGDYMISSDNVDFSQCLYKSLDYMHPLDRLYSWSTPRIGGYLEGDQLTLNVQVDLSKFWCNRLFISHGGQSKEIKNGNNRVTFKYVPGENAFIGKYNTHYKGREIDIQKLLDEGKEK